jgi:hypothetical protein
MPDGARLGEAAVPHPAATLPVMAPASLCASCSSVHVVRGRLGQVYLLCRSDVVGAKYPPQPVVNCFAYAPQTDRATSAADAGTQA